MSTPHIIIIGAGAAGLIAANELALSGRKVTVLEARNRIGGRMHTLHDERFDTFAEGGAEFIHGDLPVTKKLLKEAGIAYHEVTGEFYEVAKDGLQPMEGASEEDQLVLRQLNTLKEDMAVEAFLEIYLSGPEHAATREELRRFVEGFDSGDIKDASAFALRDEIGSRDDPQYRLEGGYIRLADHLAEKCGKSGVAFILDQQVTAVDWKEGHATLQTAAGVSYDCDAVLTTVPLALLTTGIRFQPSIPEHMAAASAIGYGSVIKILMQFDAPFWKHASGDHSVSDLSFVFSDTAIPTFWTQYPHSSSLLVGWLCGPRAFRKKMLSDEQLLTEALQSLSTIFSMPAKELRQRMIHHRVCNWAADPFTLGAYAYATVDGVQQREKLRAPIGHTIFFAGEGLYTGDHIGTVEAALVSGLYAVNQILTAQNKRS